MNQNDEPCTIGRVEPTLASHWISVAIPVTIYAVAIKTPICCGFIPVACPKIIGTSVVAPNNARMCWSPATTQKPHDGYESTSHGTTHVLNAPCSSDTWSFPLSLVIALIGGDWDSGPSNMNDSAQASCRCRHLPFCKIPLTPFPAFPPVCCIMVIFRSFPSEPAQSSQLSLAGSLCGRQVRFQSHWRQRASLESWYALQPLLLQTGHQAVEPQQ